MVGQSWRCPCIYQNLPFTSVVAFIRFVCAIVAVHVAVTDPGAWDAAPRATAEVRVLADIGSTLLVGAVGAVHVLVTVVVDVDALRGARALELGVGVAVSFGCARIQAKEVFKSWFRSSARTIWDTLGLLYYMRET